MRGESHKHDDDARILFRMVFLIKEVSIDHCLSQMI